MLVFFLFGISQSKSIADYVLKRLETHWEGIMSCSENDYSGITSSFLTLYCNSSPGKSILSCNINSVKYGSDINFFIKAEESDNTQLEVVTKIGEEIAKMKILTVPHSDNFALRGFHSPKNDQVTVSIGFTSLDLTLTDQFSPNATVVSLRRSSPNYIYNQIAKFGILITVVACIFVGIYKASDLSDVIKPEEGESALRIKHMSIAADRRNRENERKRKHD